MKKISQILKSFIVIKSVDKALVKDVTGRVFEKQKIKRDPIFSNAVARYNEMKLLKKEQLLRLASATDYTEAMRMLFDYGYARVNNFDIDGLIDVQINALNSYAREESYSNHMLKVMLNPYYYNNAKVYYKSAALNAEESGQAIFELNDAAIKDAITNKDYSALDSFMRRCLIKLDSEESKSGKDVDTAFTKAMFADSLLHAVSSMKKELISLVRAQIDVNNFITFVRCRKIKRDWGFCEPMLIKGGKISLESLKKFYDAEDGDIAAQFDFKGYEFLQKAYEGKMNLDLSLDAEVINSSVINSLSYTSFSPFLSYYYRQVTEYKIVRMILTLLKNGLKEEIDRRVRGLYD